MDKWHGRIALVTGSSAGIGADLTVALANSGMIVIGLARRVDAVQVRFLHCIRDSRLVSLLPIWNSLKIEI